MRRIILQSFATAMCLTAPHTALAGAAPEIIDFAAMPAFSGPQLTVGGLVITAWDDSGSPGIVTVQPGVGLGIEGGSSSARIDSSERLEVSLAEGEYAERLWFGFSNSLGTGVLYGFAPTGAFVGAASVPGDSGSYVTGVFGGSPLQEVLVESSAGLAIAKITIAPLEGELRTAAFDNLGTFTTPELTVGDVRVTAATGTGAPGTINVLNFNGLGVLGGVDIAVDEMESLTYEFLGETPEHLWMHVGSAGNGDGNGTVGEVRIFPHAPDGRILPPIASSGSGSFYLTPLLQNAPVRRFTVAAFGSDLHLVSRLVYALPAAGPACPSDLDGDGQVGSSDLATMLGSWGPCQ